MECSQTPWEVFNVPARKPCCSKHHFSVFWGYFFSGSESESSPYPNPQNCLLPKSLRKNCHYRNQLKLLVNVSRSSKYLSNIHHRGLVCQSENSNPFLSFHICCFQHRLSAAALAPGAQADVSPETIKKALHMFRKRGGNLVVVQSYICVHFKFRGGKATRSY